MSTPKPPKVKIQRRPLHGVLLLDKPIGFSSNDALQKVKWLMRAEKAGHTGTLDPLATGVLPLCFGAATKFSQLHLEANKAYVATLKLGQTTTTGDAEGEILSNEPVRTSRDEVLRVVASFVGDSLQTPPMYSALKHEGRPLYEYARAGIHIDRPARPISVFQAEVLSFFTSNTQSVSGFIEFDAIKIEVSCSKGTYIRTLAEDIGKALGCGAHLIGLRRISTGPFVEAQCVSLEQIEATPEAERVNLLQPLDVLLHGAAEVCLSNDNAGRFLSGLRRRGPWSPAELVAVYGDKPRALLGSAKVVAGELIPSRLLSPQEVSEILVQRGAATDAAPADAPPSLN